jgi:hypothetical protein
MAWEMAQASRANPFIEKSITKAEPVSRSVYMETSVLQLNILHCFQKAKPYKAAPIPATRPLPTVSSASTRLQSSCAFLRSSNVNRQAQVESAEKELLACDNQESDLRAEVTLVEAKKEWMEEFRGWVEMLGGFLEEKVSGVCAYTSPMEVIPIEVVFHRCLCWRRSKRI